MKEWLWIPIAIVLYFLIPFIFEGYVKINNAPIIVNQVGVIGRILILLPLIFILEYGVLYKAVSIKQIALLIGFPILILLISFIIGFLYLNSVGGLLDTSFLIVVSISNLLLFSTGAFFFYKKGKQ